MPLRKKHIRISVTVLLVAGVVGSLAALLAYGLHVRGGAYDRALAEALASRLRCEAHAERVRPTGLDSVAADRVHLVWTAGGGRLTLALEDVRAVRNPDGATWTVTAATGRLALAGEDGPATLAALNQRLVQVEADVPVTFLYVNRLHTALVLDPLRVSREVTAVMASDEEGLEVRLHDLEAMHSRELVTEALRPLASLRLAPASQGGVFAGFHADLACKASEVRRAFGMPTRGAEAKAAGQVAVTLDWLWPEADPDAATVSVMVPDLDLAAWTAATPGGPIEGTGTLAVNYRQDRRGETTVAVRLAAANGTIRGPTLAWLDALPGLAWGWGEALPDRVAFDRLAVAFEMKGGRGRFLGTPDRWGGVPVLAMDLMGREVPLLRASPEPFDATGLWSALSSGLGVGREHLREQVTGAVAVGP